MKKLLFILILSFNLIIYGDTINGNLNDEQIIYYENGKLLHKESFNEEKDHAESTTSYYGDGEIIDKEKKEGASRYKSGKLKH